MHPIVQTQLSLEPGLGVPTAIKTALTWNNGTPQATVTYSRRPGHSAGDTYLLASQVTPTVTQDGAYPWKLTVEVDFGGTGTITRVLTGTELVAVNDQSNPLGDGWGIDGISRLVPGTSGAMMVSGAGDVELFQGAGPTYQSPPHDFGTLTSATAGGVTTYTYTATDDTVSTYDNSGQLLSVVTPDGQALTYTYSSGELVGVAAPDGGVTTLNYSGGELTSIDEPGGRTVTVNIDGSGDLASVTDADGFRPARSDTTVATD